MLKKSILKKLLLLSTLALLIVILYFLNSYAKSNNLKISTPLSSSVTLSSEQSSSFNENLFNIQYGPFAENKFDIYFPKIQADSLPAIIYIHGGGFSSGDKDDINTNFKEEKEAFLNNGIIVISINYRLINKASIVEILEEDIVFAVQFIKFKATEYGIDKESIGILGSSAGGGSALYLGTHDDFQDLDNTNSIKRESTSVKVIGHINSQATYDISKWDKILEINNSNKFNIWLNKAISQKQISKKEFEETKTRIDMLLNIDKSDPPIYIENLRDNININEHLDSVTNNIINHHPKHGIYLYNIFQELGVDSELVIQENKTESDIVEFFLKYLK